MFVYIGSSISNVIYSYGSRAVTFANSIYSIIFSATITSNITAGQYNLYLSNQELFTGTSLTLLVLNLCFPE